MAYNDYLDDDQIDNALDAAKNQAGSGRRRTTTTSGNTEWMRQQGQTYLPAVAKSFGPSGMTTASFQPTTNYPTYRNSLRDTPVGGFGLGALASIGYSRGQFQFGGGGGAAPQQRQYNPAVPAQLQFSREEWMDQGDTSPGGAPTAASYARWAEARMMAGMDPTQAIGGANYLLSKPQQTQPQIQYTLPGVNAAVNALSDPSVGALSGSTRYREMGGKRQVVNTPSGGTILADSGITSKRNRLKDYTGQMWAMGNWY